MHGLLLSGCMEAFWETATPLTTRIVLIVSSKANMKVRCRMSKTNPLLTFPKLTSSLIIPG